MAGWAWIPLTLFASGAQTLRNAAQRSLIRDVGTLGATLVRFLYGLPFSLIWLAIVLGVTGHALPGPNREFVAWVFVGGVSQIAATALLLRVMTERNFALGVAYSKTEIVQVAVFALIFLGDAVSTLAALAVGLATAGLLLISSPPGEPPLLGILKGWTSKAALLGFASGAGFALAAVSYRGAALALDDTTKTLAAAYALVWAQAIQTLVLGGWLMARTPKVINGVMREWRTSLTAGFMGAAASIGWFTAMALEPVAHVRTLGLAEMLFSLAVSRQFFKERSRPAEIAGIVLLTCGLIAITASA
ncbi:MAG TPA: EamA/RhaT family transporter [Dehalococcoidia bacterium]|nr:EamA/RhaT family transporter [Dehalococcoidia bacterium]